MHKKAFCCKELHAKTLGDDPTIRVDEKGQMSFIVKTGILAGGSTVFRFCPWCGKKNKK